MKELAIDLVSRIDINIEYGYMGYKDHFKLLGKKQDDDIIIIDTIIKDKRFKTFRLIDENYQFKELHDKFGDDIFHNPDYWIFKDKLPSEQSILKERSHIYIPNYFMDIDEEDYQYLYIGKESYNNGLYYYSRWFQLCAFFTEKKYLDKTRLIELNNFRSQLMNYTFKVGGDKMYYFDDQNSDLEIIFDGKELEISWKDLEIYVKNKSLKLLLDIPKFILDKEYRIKFHKLNDFPLSFIDDFKDLKKNII